MSSFRLAPRAGEWIDRSREIAFSFEGTPCRGFDGDTLTSALMADGRRVLGRSFKYHRPRGVLSGANHDANLLFQSATRLNIRADVEPPEPGAAYHAVNTVGGLARDRARFLEWLAPVLPAGFYYKAFHRPARWFPLWEKLIRRLSGLGVVQPGFPETRGTTRRLDVDLLVVGAGAAGLAAAREALAAGLRVALVDEHARPGGSLNLAAPDSDSAHWRDAVTAELAASPGFLSLQGGFAAGFYADRAVPVVMQDGLVLVLARAIVVATGAIAQPAVFHGNDLPGVMLASAATRLVNCHAVAPCRRAVVLAANTEAYEAALLLQAAGVEVAAIADLGEPSARGDLAALAAAQGIEVLARTQVAAAHAREDELAAVTLNAAGSPGEAAGRRLECDGLLMGVGWAPALPLLAQAGARFAFDEGVGQLRPEQLPPGVFAAGRVNGHFDLAARQADGADAAAEAVGWLRGAAPSRPRSTPAAVLQSHPSPFVEHPSRKNFVDFDEDLQLADLRTGIREGFDHAELLKRYTTNGMGPSQGKHSVTNAARFLAAETGQPLARVGLITPRPFYHPVPMGTLAGPRWRPHLDTALVQEHEAAGVEWMEAGAWRRPRHYRAADGRPDRDAEYKAVRQACGIIDVSTLGKLEVVGPDAARLLDLAYPSRVSRMPEGQTRTLVLLDQRGIIVDDGIVARLGEHHFYLTAGTAHVPATARLLLQLAAFERLDVEVVERTRHLAAINVAGPSARSVLQPLIDIDLAPAALPFPAFAEAHVAGHAARVLRVGFVGECAFEVHLPWAAAPEVWRALRAAGARPFGVETQRLLRLEKAFPLVGVDTDGVTHPYETPHAALVKLDKPRFVGRTACAFLADKAERALVGFRCETEAAGGLLEDCHLVIDGDRIAGRVTSVAHSPGLGCTVGLAMLEGPSRTAGQFQIRGHGGRMVAAARVDGAFYDPTHQRMTDAQP